VQSITIFKNLSCSHILGIRPLGAGQFYAVELVLYPMVAIMFLNSILRIWTGCPGHVPCSAF